MQQMREQLDAIDEPRPRTREVRVGVDDEHLPVTNCRQRRPIRRVA